MFCSEDTRCFWSAAASWFDEGAEERFGDWGAKAVGLDQLHTLSVQTVKDTSCGCCLYWLSIRTVSSKFSLLAGNGLKRYTGWAKHRSCEVCGENRLMWMLGSVSQRVAKPISRGTPGAAMLPHFCHSGEYPFILIRSEPLSVQSMIRASLRHHSSHLAAVRVLLLVRFVQCSSQ